MNRCLACGGAQKRVESDDDADYVEMDAIPIGPFTRRGEYRGPVVHYPACPLLLLNESFAALSLKVDALARLLGERLPERPRDVPCEVLPCPGCNAQLQVWTNGAGHVVMLEHDGDCKEFDEYTDSETFLARARALEKACQRDLKQRHAAAAGSARPSLRAAIPAPVDDTAPPPATLRGT